MKMIQTSACTVHFVESHTTSGALLKSTFIMIMVRTMKLQESCMYMVSIGTECAPVASNSMSVATDYDYDPNSDQQHVAVDDYRNDSDSYEDEKWKCAKFLLHVTEEHHLTHDGVTNLYNSVEWLVDSLFSQVMERISEHLSDTVRCRQRDNT